MEVPFNSATKRFAVINHIYELRDIFSKVFRLGDQQGANLVEAMKACYQDHGIECRGAGIVEAPSKWPSFYDLAQHLEATGDDKLRARVQLLFDLGIFGDSEGTIDSFIDGSTVLALSALPGELVKKAVSEFVLKGVYQSLIRRSHVSGVRAIIVIDEAHKVANLPATQSLLREARKYGASIWLSSQRPSDFDNTVRANCNTSIFFRLEDEADARSAATYLGAPDLKADLRQLKVGECFMRNTHHQPFVRLGVEAPPE